MLFHNQISEEKVILQHAQLTSSNTLYLQQPQPYLQQQGGFWTRSEGASVMGPQQQGGYGDPKQSYSVNDLSQVPQQVHQQQGGYGGAQVPQLVPRSIPQNDLILENDSVSGSVLENDTSNGISDAEEALEPISLPSFRLKDCGYQKGRDIHCSFKYLALVYDQMCDCIDEFGKEDRFLDCQGTYDNLGFVQLDINGFQSLLEDINFEFDSTVGVDYSKIAQELQEMLKSWCPKISRVCLDTQHLYLTNLENYDDQMIYEMVQQIRLHDPKVSRDDFKRLKFIVVEFQVVFEDLLYYNLQDIGLNLSYCNYLIYRFFKQKSYQSCGFYLSCHSVKNENLPLYQGKEVKSAYCHLYLVPLNLSRRYYEYGLQQDKETESK